MRQLSALILSLLLIAGVGFTLAQPNTGDESCPIMVEKALAHIDEFCVNAGRNEACYGNISLEAEAQPDVTEFRFDDVGDIVNVADIQSIRMSAMDEVNQVWGVAVLRLQADIPDSLPGQNVTFLLFGDVTLTSETTSEQAPMQAFTLETGVGDSRCAEAPDSGLLVQTPLGVQEVTFSINGVDVNVGSTVLFQSKAGEEMTISTVEGSAIMNYGDALYPAVAGTQLRVPVDDNMQVSEVPALPQAYRMRDIAGLPLEKLERSVEAMSPMDDLMLDTLHTQLMSGQPPCGEDPLPACSDRYNNWQNPDMHDRYTTELRPERFPDLGDARLRPDGMVYLPDGQLCQVALFDGQMTPDKPLCGTLTLPSGVRLDALYDANRKYMVPPVLQPYSGLIDPVAVDLVPTLPVQPSPIDLVVPPTSVPTLRPTLYVRPTREQPVYATPTAVTVPDDDYSGDDYPDDTGYPGDDTPDDTGYPGDDYPGDTGYPADDNSGDTGSNGDDNSGDTGYPADNTPDDTGYPGDDYPGDTGSNGQNNPNDDNSRDNNDNPIYVATISPPRIFIVPSPTPYILQPPDY